MSGPVGEPEIVEVHDVARSRLAPVEYVGRMRFINHPRLDLDVAPGVRLAEGDRLLLRPGPPGTPWRTGVGRVFDGGNRTDLSSVIAWTEGDYVYRIGKPTTPSLEERVAMLERLVLPDLVVADDAEKSGRPEAAAELRARVPWWTDPRKET